MIADVVGHATAVELVWTLATFVGVLANTWGLADAWADRQWLRKSGLNGRRETVAIWHVRLNAALTWVQLAFLTAGVAACLTPNPTNHDTRLVRVIVQLLFLSAEPVLVLLAVEGRRYRARLLAARPHTR